MPLLCHLQETRLVLLIHYRAFVRLLRTQLGQSFEMYMSTKRVHIHQIVGVWGFQKSCVLTCCVLTVRVSMLLSLDAVVIVLSEGVKDTTALDEGVVMSCNVCGRCRACRLGQEHYSCYSAAGVCFLTLCLYMSVLLKLDHTVNSCVFKKSGISRAMCNIPDISEFSLSYQRREELIPSDKLTLA